MPLWQLLWPNTDNIQPMSSIKYLGSYDIDIYTKFKPTFLGLYNNEILIGSISGHKSSHEDYRIRGIYILPEYRSKGLSKILFDAIILQAQKENCLLIWSLPKKESIYAYLNKNFKKSTNYFQTTYGLNCFVYKHIIKA